MDIIQKLLREFDLERCMEMYRSLYSVEYKVDPSEFSLERYTLLTTLCFTPHQHVDSIQPLAIHTFTISLSFFSLTFPYLHDRTAVKSVQVLCRCTGHCQECAGILCRYPGQYQWFAGISCRCPDQRQECAGIPCRRSLRSGAEIGLYQFEPLTQRFPGCVIRRLSACTRV